tara:strand:- start:569 stop:1828 length:1260 start_codon:yes stop_codon:yes gene_type:complete
MTTASPAVVVQKYGGSSVATPEMISAIAERIARSLKVQPRIVVVLSAMGTTTDELVSLAHSVAKNPSGREMDLLLATGEQVSVSVLGLALQDRGIPAISLTATQCGIRTDDAYNIARIESIDTKRIVEELDRGRVVIVTGFQGLTRDHEVTTLGRGGSDITGAALAAALGASSCDICTDVDGVLSADPNKVLNTTQWSEISYEEAIEMASSGAKVLHPRAAEVCMAYDVPIHVRSSFHDLEGTWIRGESDMVMEQAEVVGVSSEKEIAKITLTDVPDRPGVAAQVFQELAEANICVRLIIQGASTEKVGRITFVVDDEYVSAVRGLLAHWKKDGLAREALIDTDVSKISIVGSRLASTPGLAGRMFAVLAREGINIDCISSSEMKIACVISEQYVDRAVQSVHDEFFPSNGATEQNVNN